MKKAIRQVQKKELIGVQIDKAKLIEAANKYLDTSSVYAAIKQLAVFSWSNIFDYWRNIVALVSAVISAIEIAKAELVMGQPDGTKVSGAIALDAAVDILDGAITFTGIVGRMVDMVDGPVLKLLVNVVLGKNTGINWTAEAFEILGLEPSL